MDGEIADEVSDVPQPSPANSMSEGIGLLKEINNASTILIVSIVSACLVLLIIAVVIAILLCRKHQKPTDKYGHNKNSPDSGYQNDDSNLIEHKAFYENLPFHGINAPGKKAGLGSSSGAAGSGPCGALDRRDDDMIYADSDYKDVYEFGPISYKNASKNAAIKKKEDLDARFKAAIQYNPKP